MDALRSLVGDSPGIAAVREAIGRILQRHSETRRMPPILILGETGTGKGLVARLLHQAGPRARGPFVDVNCAAIPASLLEAELFGFERGAFTDARQGKPGLFQTANRGTLFLDEVGLLPEGLQAKLLKAIEEREVRRLGSTRSEPVDLWVLTATSEDLRAATGERRFRPDLYHRLAVLTLAMPPLRGRGGDIVTLAEHFLARACADYGVGPRRLSAGARAALLEYPWPGNVRELANVMERVVLLSEEDDVTADGLGLAPAVSAAPAARAPEQGPIPLGEVVSGVERDQLVEALDATGWNISRAAARLRVPRNTLRYRMEKHGLHAPVRRGRPAPAPPAPAPAAAASPPGPAASVRRERRRLAILRAALPAAPDAAGPGDGGRALEVVIEKLRSFAGRVEELSAAGLVAAFGVEPIEDAPFRAALAATAIQKAASRGQPGDVDPFDVRVALHVAPFTLARLAGSVTLDAESRRDAWAVLEGLVARATPGATLVSAAAVSVLSRFEPALVDRGGPGGAVYRLTRLDRPAPRVSGRLGPFVGRQPDLALLHRRLEAAVAGRGQIVGITGDAGIGKTRLLFELRQSLTGRPVTYLETQCASYGATIPYLPVLGLIRASCEIVESDTPDEIARKVRTALEALGMAPDDTGPHLLHLLGVKEGAERVAALAPEVIKASAFDALRQVCLRASQLRPLVIVAEDLHWVDTATEEFVAWLADGIASAGILLLVTYRPGYRAPWGDRSYSTQIALGPLSRPDSLAVVRSVLRSPAVPDPVAEAILGRAEGNPLFLEELARVVADRVDAPESPPIPETVQELLVARIDGLPDESRVVLQVASVVGREASRRLLLAVLDRPASLEAPMRAVVRLEMLVEDMRREDVVYVFKHPLIQEVAYGTLVEGERRRLHGTVGSALETLYAGRTHEVVELLARHFGESDAGEKAVDYAIAAGEKAQRGSANSEALTHFEAATLRLAALADTRPNRLRRIDVVLKQAEVKFALGRHAEHVQALEGIRELVEETGDPRRRATWYYWIGFLQGLTRGRPEVAIEYCRRARDIARAAGLGDVRAHADCVLSQAYLMVCELDHALEAGESALAVFEAERNVWWACRALWALTAAANASGDWTRSLDYCRRAVEHAESVGDRRLLAVGWWRTGWAHIMRGAPETGLGCCEKSLALSPSPYDAAMARAARGYGLARMGQLDTGTGQLADAVEWFGRSGLPFTHSFFAVWLGDTRRRQGEAEKARILLEGVRSTSRDLGYRYTEALACRLLGEILTDETPDVAAGHLAAAEAVFLPGGAREALARVRVAQAGIRRLAGDEKGARELLEEALAVFEGVGTLGEPARLRAMLAASRPGAPGKGVEELGGERG
jgi:DNA-binding NtrC family response regulator/tetratricopeptide (TPR) repeat protein